MAPPAWNADLWPVLPVEAGTAARRAAERLVAALPDGMQTLEREQPPTLPPVRREPGGPPVPSYEGVGGRRMPGSGFPPGADWPPLGGTHVPPGSGDSRSVP